MPVASGPVIVALFAAVLGLGPEEDLQRAVDAANDDPEANAGALAAALEDLHRDAADKLRDRPELREQRLDALLVLARAWLAAGDEAAAAEAMDEALRSAGPEGVDGARLGPSLQRFQERREKALKKKTLPAGLEVRCEQPCRVFLNERPMPLPLPPLPPGTYRVHIAPETAGSAAPLDTELKLAEGSLSSVAWGDAEAPAAAAAALVPVDTQPAPRDDPPRTRGNRRLLPRWVEITEMVVGAAAIGAGAGLLTLDGRCPGGGDPSDGEACPDLYETTAPAVASMVVGGALLVSGTVLLSVDEVRLRGDDRGAAISLRVRF